MVVVYEFLRVLIDTWAPYGPILDCLTFNGEVGYGFPMSAMTDEQRDEYGPWLYLMLEKGIKWLLFCPKVFRSLPHQLAYDQYHRQVVEKQTNSTKTIY